MTRLTTNMEYVQLTPNEQNYAQKNLLYGQMEILTIMKRYQKYKKLRAEEHAYKLLFKRKVKEINEAMEALYKLLPHIPKPHIEEEKQVVRKPTPIPQKKRDELEEEILEIQRKLSLLNDSSI